MKITHKKLEDNKNRVLKQREARTAICSTNYAAYALYVELLSHSQDYSTSKKVLMNNIGCNSNDTWDSAFKTLKNLGFLRTTGKNRNLTYYISEESYFDKKELLEKSKEDKESKKEKSRKKTNKTKENKLKLIESKKKELHLDTTGMIHSGFEPEVITINK